MSRTCQCSLTPLAKCCNYMFQVAEVNPCPCCCRQDIRRRKEPDTPPLIPIARPPPSNFLPLPPNNFLQIHLTHQQGDEGEGESDEIDEGEGESYEIDEGEDESVENDEGDESLGDESYEPQGDENV